MKIFSIDPGKNTLGAALWVDGVLSVARLHDTAGFKLPTPFDVLVIEKPMVYPGRAQKGRQRDIIDLAIVAGQIIGQASGAKIVCYQPYQWKGQLPKKVTGERVRDLLSEVELDRIFKPKASLLHNVHDAIGIGLVYLGRARRGLL